ncbi:phage tail length tape measure family protein [Enterovirga aerilata]|uniref:Phage tail tape-measure protein n=1 Tax=Enterovirga aerilata TaxID=2730920 RepID=A0A849I5D4_9HYPH|nr:phage tail length tape measure family protein [Enterovirga sp. DB1703]NNM75066.1 phage tail tape-measure protein [Enterovirga sp. DB1703]
MATDIERLVISLDADITRLSRQLAKATGDVDTWGRKSEATARRAAKRVSDAMADATNDNRSGFRGDQWKNLGFQVNDVVTSLGSGSDVMRVLAQQGGQVYQVLGDHPGGIGGAMGEIAKRALAILTPARLVAGGIAGIGASALLLGIRWSDAQDKIERGLSGIGRRSGATVNDINRIGEAIAASGRMSVGEAREAASLVAQTGNVDRDQIESVVGLVPGYAKRMGLSAADASAEIAKLFSDPAKAADELAAKLGVIDGATLAHIRTLANQGDRQAAINALVKAIQPELDKAAEKTSVWARAWNAVANAADRAGQATTRALTAAPAETDEQRLERLIRQRDAGFAGRPARTTEPELVEALRQMGLGESEIAAQVPSYRPATTEIDREIGALEERIRVTRAAQAAEAERMRAIERSRAANDIVAQFDAAGEEIRKLDAQIAQLGRSLADAIANPDVNIEGGAEKALETYKALQDRVDLLKQSYKEGGTAASAALRQANFQAQTAGLNSYARGLAEIKFRFDEMARAAREAGNVRALPTIEAQRGAAIDAYNTEANRRALGQVAVSGDFVSQVIGAESGGNDRARNPRSTATGAGQFIESTWLRLFKDTYPEMAAGMNDAAILAMRSQRQYQEALIRAYAQENGRLLQAAGFNASDRNLHLAHFLGAGGAISMLRADPSANAASILPAAARSNPEVFRRGSASVQDILNYAQGRATGSSSAGRASQDRIRSMEAEAATLGKAAAEVERLRAVEELLTAEREKGGPLAQVFANAQDLIKGSSEKLTPELEAQRAKLLELADARAKAAATGVQARFNQDIADSRAALGRTDEENRAYSQARQVGAPGSSEFQNAYGQLRELQEMNFAKSEVSGFLKGINADLANGAKLTDAFTNAAKRLLSTLTNRAIDSLVSGLFGGLGGGGGAGGAGAGAGIFSAIGRLFGFSSGGYTGPGSKDQPAGIVHAGEYVFDKAATSRIGVGRLEAIRRGLKGYAVGGFVSPVTRVPTARAAAAGALATTFAFSPVTNLDMRGSSLSMGHVQAALDARDAELQRTFGERFEYWRQHN